ncbi:MAG: Holliday junction DNA helicase RuvA [Proteobacteria bacterium]|nr:Holliday junction DNA helicase RuvA [Pseudomonadota bacterium]
MIGYLRGSLLRKNTEGVLILVGQVGYEVLLPAVVAESLATRETGDEVELFIYYHVTMNQPRPVLIGFNQEAERAFFEKFITVEAIGPVKAATALTRPVSAIAAAIEGRDLVALRQLPGIGGRTAEKIVATLCGKMGAFLDAGPEGREAGPPFARQVEEVMVTQLGHRPAEARDMIRRALAGKPDIAGPEELFDEIYRGQE